MPRYYFDTKDGQRFVEDPEGEDLDGIEAARLQAQSGLADMAKDVVPEAGTERAMTSFVRDETGRTVIRAALVLRVELDP
jgi:hypothetical protein